jgi:molecular chaperone DnaJ
MALVQFNGALLPQLGEKPRPLSSPPAVARATYADARFLAPKTRYACTIRIVFGRYHVVNFRKLSLFLLSLCSSRGRGKHLLPPSYSLHSQTSSEQINHVPSSRSRQKRGSRFVVRAEAVSYSFVFLFFLRYCFKMASVLTWI